MIEKFKKTRMAIILLIAFGFISQKANAAELVGLGQYYPTLKSAFDDINNGTLTGNIVLELTSNTTEVSPAVLYQSGYGGFSSYSKITIYPTVNNVTISGQISLSDADNVIIDGRVNQTGSTSDLTISSTTAAILMTDAQYIKVRYCTLIGSGVVLNLSGSYNTGINFCKFNNNTLKYANRNSTQTALLESKPFLNGLNNHDDTVQNNNFENFCAWDDALYPNIVPYALILRASNYGWYIEGNSFYDTGFSVVNRYSSPRAIQVALGTSTAQPASKIMNNYIGGSAPMCGGSPLTITSTGTGQIQFVGISAVGSIDSVIVQNNTIANIALVNNKQNFNMYNYQNHLSFIGIYMYDGNAVIRNNTIGSLTNANSIVQNSTSGGDTMIAIHNNSTKNVLIEGNQIGSISGSSSTTIDATSIFGIFKNSAGGYPIIRNNTIGGNSPSTSLSALNTNTAISETIGIFITNCDSTLIEKNSIQNLNSTSTSASGGVYGIFVAVGKHLIQKNVIKDLFCSNKNVSPTRTSVAGILATASNVKITDNTIIGMNSTATDAINCSAAGITNTWISGGIKAFNNFISNIVTNSTGPQSIAVGIKGGYAAVVNNVISLGNSSRRVYGINGDVYPNIEHNTVYIYGSSNFESACLRHLTTFSITNNLFVNEKQNASGTTIRHFCNIFPTALLYAVGANYNQYYVGHIGNGGAYGRLDVTDYDVYADYQTAFGKDANSIVSDPIFVNAGGNNIIDYYPTNHYNGATNLGISNDILNNNRSGAFWAGAIQSNTPLPLTWKSFNAKKEINGTSLKWTTLTEQNTSYFEVEKSHDSKQWKTISTVSAAGNSTSETNYESFDSEILNGTSFYRIKQIDIDGKYTYSNVEKIINQLDIEMSIYPNPCSTNTIRIVMKDELENSKIEIFSIDGKVMLSGFIHAQQSYLDISSLSTGTYFIRVSNEEKTYTSKFVRQ